MKKIIFDVDGVLFSEENYFDVSALTIKEWLYDSIYFGLPTEANLSNVNTRGNISYTRHYIWGQDKLINFIKSKGINSEWDMVHAYLCTVIGLMSKEFFRKSKEKLSIVINNERDIKKVGQVLMGLSIPNSEKILEFWKSLLTENVNGLKIFDAFLSEFKQYIENVEWMELQNSFWNMHKETFLNIYLGTNLFIKEFGKIPYNGRKEGFMRFDKSLESSDKIKKLFKKLKENGYKIAIATGRKRIETIVPFTENGWLEEFDENYIATVSDAEDAARIIKCKIPDKPNPFIYYCAMFGREKSKYINYINGDVSINKSDKYVIVGDSVSDFLASQKIGVDFIGIVGLNKFSEIKEFFENKNVEVVNSVLEIVKVLKI